MTTVDTTVLPSNELNEIKLVETTPLNKYCGTKLWSLGHLSWFATPYKLPQLQVTVMLNEPHEDMPRATSTPQAIGLSPLM